MYYPQQFPEDLERVRKKLQAEVYQRCPHCNERHTGWSHCEKRKARKMEEQHGSS